MLQKIKIEMFTDAPLIETSKTNFQTFRTKPKTNYYFTCNASASKLYIY